MRLVGPLIVAACVFPAIASPCEPCRIEYTRSFAFPAGDPALPPNATLFVRQLDGDAGLPRLLRKSDGVEIPATLAPGPVADSYWLTPNDPLVPGTELEIPGLGQYTVGTDTDTAPPAAPLLAIRDALGGWCSQGLAAEIRPADDTADPYRLVVLTVRSASGERTVVVPHGDSSQGIPIGTSTQGDVLGFGELGLPESTVEVSAVVFDHAGNASSASANAQVALREMTLEHCPSSDGGPWGCGALNLTAVLFVGAALAFRRRPPSAAAPRS